MDPWPLSEKVRLTLQMIVNYTPVPLPFRRYDWIHRGSWYTGISYLKIGDIKNLEYQWEISGIESSSSLGSSYLRSPNIFLWVNLRIGDFFPHRYELHQLGGLPDDGDDQWPMDFWGPIAMVKSQNCCFFLLSFYSFCCWFIWKNVFASSWVKLQSFFFGI